MQKRYITRLFLGILMAMSIDVVASPVSTYGALKVEGNQIISTRTGQAVQLKGYSTHGPQWFDYPVGGGGTVEYMVKDFGVQVIRLAMYVDEAENTQGKRTGYLWNKNLYATKIRPLILDAINNGIYVIVDWHIHWNPADPVRYHWTPNPHTSEAVTFFDMVAKEFGNNPNIIYEVMNEPGSGISWDQVKDHVNPVYQAIRKIDPDNLILVPGPNWAQDISSVAANPLTNVTNVAYTIHFYTQSHLFTALPNAKSNNINKITAEAALAKGLALWASEWGMTDFSGSGSIDVTLGGKSDLWVSWMRDHHISWTAWNFSDASETSAALFTGTLKTPGGWPESAIKPSGKWIRERINEAPIGEVIEAEDYITMVGVKVQATTDLGGGFNVGNIDAGDWMSYSINVPATGKYVVSYRVASLNGGGVIKLQNIDKTKLYGTISVPKTSAWQSWRTISHEVTLSAGTQSIIVAAPNGGFNLNWFKVDPVSDSSSSSSVSSSVSSSAASNSSSSLATSSSSRSNSSAASSTGSVKCTQIVSNDWGSGYTGAIRFTNKGTTAINGWSITWKYSDSTKVTSTWNAIVGGTNPYTATHLSSNTLIQPGQSVDIGFNANKGSNTVNIPVFGGACL